MANLATLSYDAPYLSAPVLKVSQWVLDTAALQTTVTVTTIFDVVDQVIISSSDDGLMTSMWVATGGSVAISGLVAAKHYHITIFGR